MLQLFNNTKLGRERRERERERERRVYMFPTVNQINTFVILKSVQNIYKVQCKKHKAKCYPLKIQRLSVDVDKVDVTWN